MRMTEALIIKIIKITIIIRIKKRNVITKESLINAEIKAKYILN